MPDVSGHFRPNSPPILQETVDEDTIIVDLDSGSYFHLAGSGAYVWRLLEAGVRVEDVADRLVAVYGADRDDAAVAVEALVVELLAEGLVVAGDAAERREVEPPPGRAYAAPVLAKHTDMQELLLLDPVHDVDETGWPTPAA